MPIEIINPIPVEVLAGGDGGGSYVLNSDAFDIAIDGIPFLLATGNDRPFIREVQDIKKPMFDNFAEPGEYSMSEWWLRSQADFGGGQGLIYQDPDVDLRFNIKFKESAGVNPWSPGELRLLPKSNPLTTTLEAGTEATLVQGYYNQTISKDAAWIISRRIMKSYDIIGNAETTVNYDGGAAAVVYSMTSTGGRYYVATATNIWTGVDAGAGAIAWTTPVVTHSEIAWVKGRLMAGIDNKVYELVGAGPALPAAKFTHLDSTWTWTGIAEGPTSIYMSGKSADTTSAIYKFVLATDGTVPTLASGGTVAASMPLGEYVNDIFCYLGTFIGISTNLGFRVGEIDANGDINYGPLLWRNNSGKIQGYDRFFYVAVDDGIHLDPDDLTVATSGLYRVDLGQRTQETATGAIRYSYATDVNAGDLTTEPFRAYSVTSSGYIVGVNAALAAAPGTPALVNYWPVDAVMETGSFDLVESGWYQTGRVRYNTLEPKIFRFFSIRAPSPLSGTMDVDVVDDTGGVTRYITYTPAHPPDVGDIPLTGIFTPRIYISLRFIMHRDTVNTDEGPVINGWQIKALPAPIRQRIFTLSVLCFDNEMDKTGQNIGYEGYALERLQRMEQIAQRGNAIILQDLQNEIGAQFVIEQMQFVQTAPPGPVFSGYGGYITIRAKTVADVIT